ncbi:hypothetical protein PF010_g8936 [Phytophthora fragariae]|uniref:PWWP domain-containing protein n=1 Tax=Phytophthora fragariae TaxID=53985 RepID=A0A6G0LD16_9STRA|nr:hypothetical protein PF010_g8936 [Phytophthora fragariae]KAE9239127.1 hypothetical protein PF004_g8096 [Phytophthora fragariae]
MMAMPLDIGLRVDVLDDEGIWNTGVVVDVGKEDDEDEDKVEIKYDGWGDDYNQWVGVATQRLAPLHTYTIVKKCWAKLTKWPWWPAFVVLRAPTTALAAQGLEEETKLYVEFYDSFNEDKRSRCWMQKKNVAAFRDGFEERASKNIGKNFPKFVEGTQRAKAGTSPLLFSGPGTLPIEYSSKLADPLEEKKKECTSEQWFHLYRDFSYRYQELYGYTAAPTSSSGKMTPSSSAIKTGKRGPGRPPKKAPKEEQSEDDDESEEKEEEPEADAVEESGDDDEEEEEAVPALGRRTRQNKRPAAPAPSTRRSTRARRVKVIEELTQTSPSSSSFASSFSPPQSVREARSRSSSIARDSSHASVVANHTEFRVKSEVRLDAEQPSVQVPSWSKLSPVHGVEDENPASPEPKEPPSMPDSEMLRDEQPTDEWKPSAPAIEASRPPNAELAGGNRRRKDPMAPPAKLSERISTAKLEGPRNQTAQRQASEQDPDFYQDWSGGSRYEVDNKPWNILGWLTKGFKNRLQRK